MTEQTKDWKKITKDELFDYSFRQNMCDFEIAKIYGVSPEKVSYKRNKFNLKRSYCSDANRRLYAEHLIEGMSTVCELDKECKQKLLEAITEFFNKEV